MDLQEIVIEIARGKPATLCQALCQWFHNEGFVHITGLPYRDLALKDDGGFPVEGLVQPSRHELGRYDKNNGKTVVITQEGQVWLCADYVEFPSPLLSSLCPNGCGAFVPCTNTDVVDMHCLLERVRNPMWPGHSGEYSPRPVFRD